MSGIYLNMPFIGPTQLCWETCLNDFKNKAKERLDEKEMKMICTRLNLLLGKAQKYKHAGDDKMGYIFYLKWLNCIRWLQKKRGYGRRKDFIKPYITVNQVKRILDLVEKLSKKLTKKLKADNEKLKNSTIKMLDTNKKMKMEPDDVNNDDLLDEIKDVKLILPDTPTADSANEEPETSITSREMCRKMKKLGDRIIIVDIRTREEFQDSHINSQQCINIPSDVIKPGILMRQLLMALQGDKQTCDIFCHRDQQYCDLIVLLDWQTTKATLKPSDQLNVLKIILLDWDPGVTYRQILILDGGYKEWLSRFSTFTTNPIAVMPDLEDNSLAEMLIACKYLNWNPSDKNQSIPEIESRPIPARNLELMLNAQKKLINRTTNIMNGPTAEWSSPLLTPEMNLYTINSFSSIKVEKNDELNDKLKSAAQRSVHEKNINENDARLVSNSKVYHVSTKPLVNDIEKQTIDGSSELGSENKSDTDLKKVLNLLERKKDLSNSQLKLVTNLLPGSLLYSSKNKEDVDSVQKVATLNRVAMIDEAIAQMIEQMSAIDDECEADTIVPNPLYRNKKNEFDLDIGLAEHETRAPASKRKEITSEGEKKKKKMNSPLGISGATRV